MLIPGALKHLYHDNLPNHVRQDFNKLTLSHANGQSENFGKRAHSEDTKR